MWVLKCGPSLRSFSHPFRLSSLICGVRRFHGTTLMPLCHTQDFHRSREPQLAFLHNSYRSTTNVRLRVPVRKHVRFALFLRGRFSTYRSHPPSSHLPLPLAPPLLRALRTLASPFQFFNSTGSRMERCGVSSRPLAHCRLQTPYPSNSGVTSLDRFLSFALCQS